jgi:hypothetical protein
LYYAKSLFRINFGSASACEDWSKRITDEISAPTKVDDIFAFAHFAWISETGNFCNYEA